MENLQSAFCTATLINNRLLDSFAVGIGDFVVHAGSPVERPETRPVEKLSGNSFDLSDFSFRTQTKSYSVSTVTLRSSTER